jgi:hypothetical protein
MNEYCSKDCKYKGCCRLDEDKTRLCKVEAEEDDKIFGLTFEQILNKQQRK